jgi:hypothetical protein
MTPDRSSEIIAALAELLKPHLERSPVLRDLAQHVGEWLIEEAKRASGSTSPNATRSRAADTVSSPQIGIDGQRSAPSGAHIELRPVIHDAPRPIAGPTISQVHATVPLRIGGSMANVPVLGTPEGIIHARRSALEPAEPNADGAAPDLANWENDEIDLALIEKRARLKAESCRVVIARRAAAGDPLRERGLVDRLNELIREGKSLPNCFLWAFWREREQPPDETLATIAACYDSLAETVGLVNEFETAENRVRPEEMKEAFQLLAEGNSALRVALLDSWLTAPDRDQDEAHAWIRRETERRRIFVPRHMRLDDPADPGLAADLTQRVRAARTRFRERSNRDAEARNFFGRIAYHARRIADGALIDESHDWHRIADAADSLLDLGVPPTDTRFRDVLPTSIARACPPPYSQRPEVRRVLDAVLAREGVMNGASEPNPTDAGDEPETESWSQRVLAARDMLRRGSIVIIGGEPRPEAIIRFKRAFDLDHVEWVYLTEHGSGEPMRAPIGRSSTRLVVVIVRLAGHLHVEEAVDFARAAGKPVVLLKAGYNPEQIAEAIHEQASRQLLARADVMPRALA